MTWRQRYERVLRQRGYTHGEAAREFERNFIRVGSKDA
jgi:hypothetical protein